MNEEKPPHANEVDACVMILERAQTQLTKGDEGSTRLAAIHLGILEERLRSLHRDVWNAWRAQQDGPSNPDGNGGK